MKKLDFDIAGIRCANLIYNYNQSIESGLNHINFYDIIWSADVEPIVRICRANKIKFITFSCNQASVQKILWEFQNQGCKLAKNLVLVKARWSEEPIPAFKILL